MSWVALGLQHGRVRRGLRVGGVGAVGAVLQGPAAAWKDFGVLWKAGRVDHAGAALRWPEPVLCVSHVRDVRRKDSCTEGQRWLIRPSSGSGVGGAAQACNGGIEIRRKYILEDVRGKKRERRHENTEKECARARALRGEGRGLHRAPLVGRVPVSQKL